MREISEVLNVCDISFVGVANKQALWNNSANKFFDSISAGKPVIINYKGWMKEIIEEHNCGMPVDPEDPIDFCRVVKIYLKDRNLLKEHGENARRLAEAKYSSDTLTDNIVNLVSKVTI
jgi:glycosyltransferase involved in cell wall biosynthesis